MTATDRNDTSNSTCTFPLFLDFVTYLIALYVFFYANGGLLLRNRKLLQGKFFILKCLFTNVIADTAFHLNEWMSEWGEIRGNFITSEPRLFPLQSNKLEVSNHKEKADQKSMELNYSNK